MLKLTTAFALLSLTSARFTASDNQLWSDYKNTFNWQWSAADEEGYYACFRQNLDLIESFNADEDTAQYGLNQYSHLCHAEFKSHYGGLVLPKNRTRNFDKQSLVLGDSVDFPSSMDWRTKGAVTHVKNQGQCGSCWAFSAVGAMEGAHFLATGELLDLSEEELVQCSSVEGNMGCQGGIMDKAFDWVKENGGIDSESDYPYTSGAGVGGRCKTAKKEKDVAKFSGHIDLPHNEKQIAAFVSKHGPVSVAVDAGPRWQLYTSGIKSTCFAGQLDHGVLIVGYGSEDDVPYWIVKNSWGPMWGESGYIRLKRGANCNGIAENACTVKV